MTSDDRYVTVNGARLYLDRADERANALIIRGGHLHPAAAMLWRHAVSAAQWDWIIDVGANYGEMLLAVDLRGQSRIAAVEPNPRVRVHLARTLREALPWAVVLPYAISDTSGSATIYEDMSWSGNTTLSQQWAADRADHTWRSFEVATVTLAGLLSDIGAASKDSVLLKLDIEGYEARVLRAAHSRLSTASHCVLMVEIVRFNNDDLEWLFSQFVVYCLENTSGRLIAVDGLSTQDFSALIKRGDLYGRDVLAAPRSAESSSPQPLKDQHFTSVGGCMLPAALGWDDIINSSLVTEILPLYGQ